MGKRPSEPDDWTTEVSSAPSRVHAEASGSRAVAAGHDIHGIVQTGDGAYAVMVEMGAVAAPSSVDTRPGLNDIPKRTALFVGRVAELDQLDGSFGTGRALIQAVHGLGGIGKSALAAHWAATRDHGCYPVRWINAETPASVVRGLAEFATDLEPALMLLPSVEAQAQWAVQWLACHTDWLLILDNVDRPSDVEALLARASGGRVLITSRAASSWRDIPTVCLDVLSESEAVDLFARIARESNPPASSDVAALCEAFGYLPLAIEQAAAYIGQNPLTSPRGYLELLEQYPAAMYRQSAAASDEQRTIARIWRATLDKVTAKEPLSGVLLRILAWYASDAIPQVVPTAVLTGFAEPPKIDEAVSLLVAYSMVRADQSTQTYSVHRLVQSYMRTPDLDDPHRLPELIDQARGLSTHLHLAAPEHSTEPSDATAWQLLMPQIDSVFGHTNPESADALHLLHAAGTHFIEIDKPQEGISYLRRAAESATRFFGEFDTRTLLYRHNLGTAYQAAFDLESAIEIYEDVLEAREMVLGKDHPDTIVTRSNLACVYSLSGDLELALPILEDLVARNERDLGKRHPKTLDACHNLACTYRDAGEVTQATRMFESIFAIACTELGERHPDTLTYRHNLATAYADAGDLQRAIPLLEQSMAITTEVHGDHHSTLLAQNSLALAYGANGDTNREIPLLKEALDSAMRLLGENHPHTKIIRENLAKAAARQER